METQEKLLMMNKINILKTCHLLGCLTLFLLFSSFSASQSFAHPIIQFWQNRAGLHEGLILGPELSFYSTSSNADLNSQKANLPNNSSLTRTYLDLNASYGFSESFFVFGRLTALSSKVENYPNFSDYSNFGLGDQLIGLAYRILSSSEGINFTLQGDASLPAYQNNKSDAKPFLGDASTDLTLGSFLEIPLPFIGLSDFNLEVGAGYTYRSKAYSASIPWSVLFKREPFYNGYLFTAGIRGNYSLQTDNTNPSVAISDTNLGAGGSDLINAINPSWVTLQASFGYKISNGTSFYLLGANPITGKNSPNGLQISLGAKFEFGNPNRSLTQNESSQPKKLQNPHTTRFNNYDLDGLVMSVNDQLHVLKINKGLEDGVEKGQFFDIFKMIETQNQDQKSERLIARAKITHVKNNESALIVLEYYQDQWIDKGFTVRRLVK